MARQWSLVNVSFRMLVLSRCNSISRRFDLSDEVFSQIFLSQQFKFFCHSSAFYFINSAAKPATSVLDYSWDLYSTLVCLVDCYFGFYCQPTKGKKKSVKILRRKLFFYVAQFIIALCCDFRYFSDDVAALNISGRRRPVSHLMGIYFPSGPFSLIFFFASETLSCVFFANGCFMSSELCLRMRRRFLARYPWPKTPKMKFSLSVALATRITRTKIYPRTELIF